MGDFLKAVSHIFHPLFIPMAGTLAYFVITPKYSPLELQSGNILPIFILTVIIPIVAYLILRNVGLVKSIFMPSRKERKYPLLIHIALLLMIIVEVVPDNYVQEIHYYFLGLTAAAGAALFLLFLKVKASLHLMGMGGLFMFLTALSVHFEVNITIALSILALLTGLVATSRLYLKAHSKAELFIGLCLGVISQLLMVRFWL
ncbi:MAG: hypothetical protein AAFX53_00305 [Bacteroidota bacterium]